jgi:hypothetical protein
MFLRRCQRRKDGKTHTYWALRVLLNRLGLTRPKRVRSLAEPTPMW